MGLLANNISEGYLGGYGMDQAAALLGVVGFFGMIYAAIKDNNDMAWMFGGMWLGGCLIMIVSSATGQN